jgi:hypothetical protein
VEYQTQPTDDKVTESYLRWRFTGKLAGIVLLSLGLLVILLIACVLWIPSWLYPALGDADLQAVSEAAKGKTITASDAAKVEELKGARLKLQNDARTTLLQPLSALLLLSGAAIGASVAFQQVRATRDQISKTAKASHDQLKLTEQGQFTDRFTKAIDQLDEKKALAVRLGGLYALERIVHDSPRDRATIAEVLCAYARTAPRPEPPPVTEDIFPTRLDAGVGFGGAAANEPGALTTRAPDVQAALTILLGRWRSRLVEPPPYLDLHGADLRGASLSGAQLQGARLDGAQLQGTHLRGAQLHHAVLFGAQLPDTIFNAQLRGAWADDHTHGLEVWNHSSAEAAGVRFMRESESKVYSPHRPGKT